MSNAPETIEEVMWVRDALSRGLRYTYEMCHHFKLIGVAYLQFRSPSVFFYHCPAYRISGWPDNMKIEGEVHKITGETREEFLTRLGRR